MMRHMALRVQYLTIIRRMHIGYVLVFVDQ